MWILFIYVNYVYCFWHEQLFRRRRKNIRVKYNYLNAKNRPDITIRTVLKRVGVTLQTL